MTSTDIVLRGNIDLAVIEPLSGLASQIAKTEFVPSALRNRPEAVLACMLTGQEVGIAPMQALRQIDIIDGRPSLRAELMRALVLDRGHELWFGQGNEYTTTRVVAYGRRSGGGEVTRVEWTIDMAKQAKLDGKTNWRNHPRQMLAARATAELCRLVFPDIVAGMGYTQEELEDGFTDDTVVDGEIVDAPKTTKKSTSSTTKRTRRKTAPAPAPTPEPELPDEDDIEDAEIVEEPAPAPEPEEEPQTDEERARSREIVRLAKALKVDHHPIVSYVTAGVTESAKRLSAADAAKVMDAIRAISEGRARVGEKDGRPFVFAVAPRGPEVDDDSVPLPDEETPQSSSSSTPPADEDDEIADAEIVEDDDEEDDENDPEDWGVEVWRAFLAAKNVKVTALLRRAAAITGDGDTPVGALADVAGSGKAKELKRWVEEQGS